MEAQNALMISIVTPTYNRAHCLPLLYASIQRQTSRNFEWIIVDDGSDDGTDKLVTGWQQEPNDFEILYRYKPNGGKHTAWNVGVGMARGEFLFVMDSDDVFTPDAIEKMTAWCMQIRGDDRFAGISGRKGYPDGRSLGHYPAGRAFVDATQLERFTKHLNGDKADVYKTAILKRYPFPEYEGERFLSEAMVWDEIGHDGYLLRYFPDVVCLCEYREDGLTQNSFAHISKSFRGFTEVKRKGYRYYPFPHNWKALIAYVEVARRCGKSRREIMDGVGVGELEYAAAAAMCGMKRAVKQISRYKKRY